MIWTLACNGAEKTLADWGLSQVRRTLVSQGSDELTFRATDAAADASPLFPYKATATLWRDRQIDGGGNWTGGTSWFRGLVTQIPRAGAPDAESMSYRISGPWWYLDNLVFLQPWQQILLTIGSGGNPLLGPSPSSHLFLNMDSSSSLSALNIVKITTGQQIIAALNWCLAPFAGSEVLPPFQIGRVTPAVDVPIDEVHDITCAEVIHKMLRWTPDAVTYFDYSTTPPTFHCVRRADMEIRNVDGGNT